MSVRVSETKINCHDIFFVHCFMWVARDSHKSLYTDYIIYCMVMIVCGCECVCVFLCFGFEFSQTVSTVWILFSFAYQLIVYTQYNQQHWQFYMYIFLCFASFTLFNLNLIFRFYYFVVAVLGRHFVAILFRFSYSSSCFCCCLYSVEIKHFNSIHSKCTCFYCHFALIRSIFTSKQ